MGISSSLNAGVMGLNVNATRLSAISDNIANSSTIGYKRAEVDFASLISGSGLAGQGEYAAGGVRVSAARDVLAQGSLTSTNNATDIAITGRGLIPVTTVNDRDLDPTARDFLLTPTGSFAQDQEGYLTTSSGLQLLGWPADATGAVNATSRESGLTLEPVRLIGFEFASNPTTEIELGINLPAGDTSETSLGTPYNTTVEYFDDLGNSESLNITFTPAVAAAGAPDTNQWTMLINDSASGNNIGELDLQFFATGTEAGSLDTVVPDGLIGTPPAAYDPATGLVTLTLPATGREITLNLGAEDGGKLVQFSSPFTPVNITKDGTAIGALARIELTPSGTLEAIYDTGLQRTIYQIPVADVPNPNGLTARDNQAFQISTSSGSMYLWDAGTGPTGSYLGFALEQSSTDIAQELTQLIETQRAYSSNAKIIQTVDEMLQETTNLKR